MVPSLLTISYIGLTFGRILRMVSHSNSIMVTLPVMVQVEVLDSPCRVVVETSLNVSPISTEMSPIIRIVSRVIHEEEP